MQAATATAVTLPNGTAGHLVAQSSEISKALGLQVDSARLKQSTVHEEASPVHRSSYRPGRTFFKMPDEVTGAETHSVVTLETGPQASLAFRMASNPFKEPVLLGSERVQSPGQTFAVNYARLCAADPCPDATSLLVVMTAKLLDENYCLAQSVKLLSNAVAALAEQVTSQQAGAPSAAAPTLAALEARLAALEATSLTAMQQKNVSKMPGYLRGLHTDLRSAASTATETQDSLATLSERVRKLEAAQAPFVAASAEVQLPAATAPAQPSTAGARDAAADRLPHRDSSAKPEVTLEERAERQHGSAKPEAVREERAERQHGSARPETVREARAERQHGNARPEAPREERAERQHSRHEHPRAAHESARQNHATSSSTGDAAVRSSRGESFGMRIRVIRRFCSSLKVVCLGVGALTFV